MADPEANQEFPIGTVVAIVGVLISGVWLYLQLQVWKEEGHDHILTAVNIVATLVLWACLSVATYLNVRDARRAKSLRAQIVTIKEDCALQIREVERRAIAPRPEGAKPSRLKILSADYRASNGKGVPYDVTDCLQKMVRGDGLVLDIENHNFQANGRIYVDKDPAFGVMKLLSVDYSFDGAKARAIRPERSRIVLPEDTFIASAIAGVPLIPFSKLQLEAFQIAKEMREFAQKFDPEPPEIDARKQDEHTRQRLMVERSNWRTTIWSAYELRFEERKRKLILEFGAGGYSLDLRQYSQERHDPARVIAREADAITALAHKVDGARLSVEM